MELEIVAVSSDDEGEAMTVDHPQSKKEMDLLKQMIQECRPTEDQRKTCYEKDIPVIYQLPNGWHVEERIREWGRFAGRTEWFYYEPVTCQPFRSLKSIHLFMKTGTTKKHVPKHKEFKPETPYTSSLSSGSRKRNNSGVQKITNLSVDLANPPANISKALTGPEKDTRSPLVDDQMVQEVPIMPQWGVTLNPIPINVIRVHTGPEEDTQSPFVGEQILPEPIMPQWGAIFDSIPSKGFAPNSKGNASKGKGVSKGKKLEGGSSSSVQPSQASPGHDLVDLFVE